MSVPDPVGPEAVQSGAIQEPLPGLPDPVEEQVLAAYGKAVSGEELPADPFDRLDHEYYKQAIRLRKIYGFSLIIAMGVVLLVADGIFVGYSIAYNFKDPTPAIQVWLGATVVQVVGVVAIVTRSLFPSGTRFRDRPKESRQRQTD